MSIKRMSAVWDFSQAKGSHLLLLLAIADHADDDGFAWPGTSRLADKTRMSGRHVHRMVNYLEDCGELYVEQLQSGDNNRYIVLTGLATSEISKTLSLRFKKSPAEIAQILKQIEAKKAAPRQSSSDNLSLGSDSCVTTQPSINVNEEEEEGHKEFVNCILPALEQPSNNSNSKTGNGKTESARSDVVYSEIDEAGDEIIDLSQEALLQRVWNATLSSRLSGPRPKLTGSQQQQFNRVYASIQKDAEYASFVGHQIDWCNNNGNPVVGIKKFLVSLLSPDIYSIWKNDNSYNAMAISGVTKGAVPLSRNSGEFELRPMVESSSTEFSPLWDQYFGEGKPHPWPSE